MAHLKWDEFGMMDCCKLSQVLHDKAALTLARPGFQVKTVCYLRRGSMELPVLFCLEFKKK